MLCDELFTTKETLKITEIHKCYIETNSILQYPKANLT